ncbi:DNA/RNA non-specific endonuclease [Roseivirga echinicomitans]
MAKRKAAVSSRGTAKKKTTSGRKGKKGGFNLWKFSLALIILICIGYAYLAIKEEKLIPSFFDEEATPVLAPEKVDPQQEIPEPIKETSTQEKEEKLDFDSYDLYFAKAFDFAWPAYEADQAIVERPYYTLRYSEEHEQAMWVAYILYADSLRQDTFERKDDFREDTRIKTGSASLSDYKGSGYDRGHIAPAADFSYSEFALSQSFFMSNMSPQDPSFNRGIWKKLEEQVRSWAMENEQIYVVTGPVLNKQYKTIGPNKVSVPEYYYKVVLDMRKPEIKAIAFIMRNEASSAPLSSFVVTIDSVEQLTGLDFFPGISDELEDALEGSLMILKWF